MYFGHSTCTMAIIHTLPGCAKKTLPPHDKRLFHNKSPIPPSSMMPIGKCDLKRAKKTLVYDLRRLLPSCASIIEEGGVGGRANRIFLSRERFFCTHRNQNLSFKDSIGEDGSLTRASEHIKNDLRPVELGCRCPTLFGLLDSSSVFMIPKSCTGQCNFLCGT